MNHTIAIPVTLKPFEVPEHIEVANNMPLPRGFSLPPRIPLSDLSTAQLVELCNGFRTAVFEKAGRQDYRVAVQDGVERRVA